MTPWLAVATREVRALLRSTTGWLVLAGFQVAAGVFWLALLDNYVVRSRDRLFDPYGAAQLDLVDHLLAPFFGNLTVLLLVLGPAVAMRAFSEERRAGTMELLLAAPVRGWEVVLGKFVGAYALVLICLATTLWMPASLAFWRAPDPGAVLLGYVGLGLLGAAVVAVGLLAAAFAESAVVALVLAFAAVLALWIVGWVDPDPTSWAGQLSLSRHVQDPIHGALHLSDLGYFAALVGWCLVAAWQRVESWRWA